MIVPAVILILAGLGLIWLAVASWQERLPRNGLAGVRTPATMRSDQAFTVANKVAGIQPFWPNAPTWLITRPDRGQR